ncbi:MAG: DNA/RNA helicase domain-containing protein, partial [Bacteroidota bacterium]
NNICKPEHKAYHINAYRVLLTRARQGMVIVVPHGASDDHTRQPGFYDDTYAYLKGVGVREV